MDTYKMQKVSITRFLVEIWTPIHTFAADYNLPYHLPLSFFQNRDFFLILEKTQGILNGYKHGINKAAASVLRQAQQPCDSITPPLPGCRAVVPRQPHYSSVHCKC